MATWSRSDQMRRRAVHPGRGKIQMCWRSCLISQFPRSTCSSEWVSTIWCGSLKEPHQMVPQDLRGVRQARSIVCPVNTRWEDMAATNWWSDFKCKRGMLESTAKKMRILKSGENAMMPVRDLDRAKIDAIAHSLYAVILDEYTNGQFKLGIWYINSCLNKISKISIN